MSEILEELALNSEEDREVHRAWREASKFIRALLDSDPPNKELFNYLISNGGNPPLTGHKFTFTACHISCMESHVRAVESILQHPCNVNASGLGRIIPLFLAIVRESVEMVEMLLANGADVNSPNPRTPWPFRRSFENQNPYITLLLLQNCDFAAADSVLMDCMKYVDMSDISPQVVDLFFKLGVKRSSFRLLSSYIHKQELTNYNQMTYNVYSLKQLSRIAVRNMFYSKWRHLSINEIMKNLGLPTPVCNYLTYKTGNDDFISDFSRNVCVNHYRVLRGHWAGDPIIRIQKIVYYGHEENSILEEI